MRDADGLFDAGLDCLGMGDWEGAVARLQGALALEPGHREAAHGLMRALDQAGRGEEAVAVAERLIAEDAEDVLARTGLSMIYQRMGRITEAEKVGLEAKLLGWKMELRRGVGSDGEGLGLRGQGLEGGAAPRIYVASSNAGKLRDFAAASGGRVRLEALPGLAGIEAPAEDEETFEGNATLKAVYYSGFAAGEVVVADDSGLEVDGLGGRPGVRSARFAEDCGFVGGGTVDEGNNRCLVEALRGVTGEGRRGRYRCALVAARDGVVVGSGFGSVEGWVLEEARGRGGFGYDPLFYVEERGKTMAEMGGEERLGVSHRGRALIALMAELLVGE